MTNKAAAAACALHFSFLLNFFLLANREICKLNES